MVLVKLPKKNTAKIQIKIAQSTNQIRYIRGVSRDLACVLYKASALN